MAQGPSANPEKFSPPGPWGAGQPPLVPGVAAGGIPSQTVDVPFIASTTVVYDLTLDAGLAALPFIASTNVFYPILFSGSGTYTFDTSTTWTCPEGVFSVKVECRGGGGGGGESTALNGYAGGGGGAYAENGGVPVTPGNTYTFTVAGTVGAETNGGTTTFTGDSSTIVAAVGGGAANDMTAGAGGLASASTGITKFSGGNGGTGLAGAGIGGAGGGEGAASTSNGNNGSNSILDPTGRSGGTGTDGGNGGAGGSYLGSGNPGVTPGGGGGGAAGNTTTGNFGGNGAPGRIQITVYPTIEPPFIASTTVVYPLIVEHAVVDLALPFIPSTTVVYEIAALYQLSTGPGNGGETFPLQLAPIGTSETATVAVTIATTDTSISLTGDSTLPATGQFCLTIDNEVLLVTKTSSGTYRIVQRPLSNTSVATHTAGATATWTDGYDMAVLSASQIGATIDYTVDGQTYDAWLQAFDSSQAYLATDRYAIYVSALVGVFPAGAGSTGNKLDSTQPSAEHAPATATDDCPVGITVPSRLTTDIAAGDVALLRYANPEAAILTLGPRSSSIQAWYAFMRVTNLNVDVTTSDPTANIVDGSVNDEFLNTNFVTVTLPGTDRTFTYGPPHYSDKGWPIAALAVRQGTRRVPHWTSPDWHNFSYVYSGFSDDATFVQVLINRNGFDSAHPELGIELPGPQDIDGPNATWDDETYYSSVAWGVFLFKPNATTILVGPPFNPPPPAEPQPPSETVIPVVPPQPGGGTTVTPPIPIPEGGEGGDIPPPGVGGDRFWVALV